MKVLVATDKPFAKVAVDGIRKEIEAAGYELALLEKYGDKAKLLDAVKDANAIIIRSDIIDAEVLDAAKELKIVVRAGAGYDNVDLAAATAHNVCVMNTPGQNSNAVAELAFGLMVMAVRNMYNGTSGTELMGKKLGIHAYGNVAHCLADAAGCLCHLLDQCMNGLGGFIDGCADGHDGIHHILLFFLVGFQFGELLCVVQDGHAGCQTGNCVDDNNNGADHKDHIGFGKRVGSKHMDRVNTV